MEEEMQRRALAIAFCAAALAAAPSAAFADRPPGQLGHEGQPGDQGGG
jgi:hypothetical protein